MCDPPDYCVPPSNTPVPPPRQVIFQQLVDGHAIFGVMRPARTASCGAFAADRSRQLARVQECKTALLVGDPRPVQIPTKIVMHHENPLGAHQVLTPELLRNENFILMGPDHTTQTQLFQAFEQAGVRLKSSIHSHLFKSLLSFVKEDMGVALVDDFAIENDHDPRFISRPFTPQIYTEMAIITSATRPLPQIGSEFLDLLQQKLKHYAAQ